VKLLLKLSELVSERRTLPSRWWQPDAVEIRASPLKVSKHVFLSFASLLFETNRVPDGLRIKITRFKGFCIKNKQILWNILDLQCSGAIAG